MFRKLRLLPFLLLTTYYSVHAQVPVVSIVATPTSGCAPLGVSFNGSATGGPVTWNWNFGATVPTVSQATNTSQNTATQFNVPGSYTVTLTATNIASGISGQKTVIINVNPVPTADFNPSITMGCFPTTVNFTNSSTAGPGGTIVSFLWDFGDGYLDSTDQNPSHIYQTGGSFPVTLVVQNNFGCNGKAQVKNLAHAITLSNGIAASFVPSLNSSCTLPVSATFTNQTIGPMNMSYSWNFGDGSGWSSTQPSPTNNYATAGLYTVQLAATSSQGCTDTVNSQVNISASGSISDFTGAGNVCINTLNNFTNTSSPPPNSSSWDFGDGSPIINAINSQHIYPNAGTFNVTLTNTFAGCTGTVVKTVTVVNPTVTAFTATNLASCKPPLTTQFTDQTVGATSWSWNFGDGTPPSNQQNPAHTYTTLGSFQVSLTTSSAAGCSNTLIKPAFVNVAQPTVSITNAPANGCAPFVYTPTISVSAVDGVASYAWNFDNGFVYNGLTPPPQTYAAGTYNITLTITTNGGCTATASGVVNVGTIQPITAFTAIPTTACVGQNIQFTDQSTGNPNSWFWTFGDASTSPSENPLYSYTKPGTYDVSLTAFNNGCFQKLTKLAYITINPPLAGFTYSHSCGAINVYTFVDASIGATTWDWNFGDGSLHSNAQAPPPHTYAPGAPTIYPVTLTVTNGAGCSNSITQQIDVNQITTINPPVNPVCNNSLVIVSTSGPNNIVGYLFDFGDGSPPQGSGSGVSSHTYHHPGVYQITVTTTDNTGCMATSPPYNITVSGPTVQFTTPNQISCGPLAATFTDQSTAAPGSSLTSWSWDFGDGSTAIGQVPPPHNYNFQGIYQVTEKVTDNNGCSDSLIQPNYITVSIPAAAYTTTGVNFCPSSNIQFTNTSTGGFNPTYVWDFKDGTTFPGANPPLHNFPLVGMYAVSLTMTDAYNCTSTYTNNLTPINIDTPNATFTMSVSNSACPPLTEQFTFAGHYPLIYTWNFDNGGGSSTIPDPKAIYAQPGDFFPSLTVTSPGGCIATFSDHIHIDGPIGALSYSPLTGCDSLNVTFVVATSNTVSFIWNFNDGSTVKDTVPTITHEYNMPNIYPSPFVTLVDASGCSLNVFGTGAIEIDSISQTTFTVDRALLCDSGLVNFTSKSIVAYGTTVTNYSWNFGDGSPVVNGMDSVIAHTFNTTGSYPVNLTISTLGGCSGAFSLPISVVSSPQIDISGLLSQCQPAVLSFSGIELAPDPNGPLTWSWNFGNGQTANVQIPSAVSYPKAGNYPVQLIGKNTKGCTDTANQVLLIYPIPIVDAGSDVTICDTSTLQLNASGTATSYNWLPPVIGNLSCLACLNPTATSPASTYFVVQGTTPFGCQAQDTINVTVNTQVTVNATGTDSVCLGQSASLNATGAAIYNWTPAEGLNNPNIANPVATPDASQIGNAPSAVIMYTVKGYDDLKCYSDTKSITITAFNYPAITLTPNATINVGSSYQINASATTNIVSLNWTPSNTLSCSDCLMPLATPTKTTKYDLTATNDGGCSTSDSIRVQVICDGANFFVPNSFSPNGDGINDRFIVNGVGLNVIPSITIYNRWGQIVFQKSNFAPNTPADAWDGTFNGQPAPSDVYVYTIQILCNNATLIPYHGNVTLIR